MTALTDQLDAINTHLTDVGANVQTAVDTGQTISTNVDTLLQKIADLTAQLANVTLPAEAQASLDAITQTAGELDSATGTLDTSLGDIQSKSAAAQQAVATARKQP